MSSEKSVCEKDIRLSEFSEAVSGEIIHADGGAHSVGGTMLP